MHAACSFVPSRRPDRILIRHPLVRPASRPGSSFITSRHRVCRAKQSTTRPSHSQIITPPKTRGTLRENGGDVRYDALLRAPAVRPRAAAQARAADGGPGTKWWAPLLGWSGQPDYIDAPPAGEAELQQKQPPRRFGVLTEDKARQLRARMMETESFHDAMYHSAIASRHASAAPDGKGH